MTFLARAAAVAALAALVDASAAAPRTVTLSVPGMNCAACPITVKQALLRVSGVEQATVSLPRREAVVRFDDARTGVEALTEATRNAGYPSQPVAAAP